VNEKLQLELEERKKLEGRNCTLLPSQMK